MMLAPTELSRRLTALREQHDPPLSQQEAADVIGLSIRQYGRLERGQAEARLATIRKIADAYGVEPRFLTGDDSDRHGAPRRRPLGDLARLEAKIDLLLEYFNVPAVEEAVATQTSDRDAGVTRSRSRPPAPPVRRHGARRPT